MNLNGSPVTSTNALPVTGSGTAGTPASGVQTVQGIASGTPVAIRASAVGVSVTPTCDTSAYAAGDLLFDMTAISNAALTAGDTVLIQSLTVIDKDAQAKAMDVYIGSGNTTLGTLNSAPNISDANIAANDLQLLCQIGTGDYATISGASVATIKNLALPVQSVTTTLYIGAVTQGAPTQTASGLVLRIGIVR